MKKKDVEQCQTINLSTDPKEILKTMQLELPTVSYFFKKDFGGNRKFLEYEDKSLDKCLKEEQSSITDISEYISQKGNRWMSYSFFEYFPSAKYAQAWPTSFIYYETYGSCGAFFPIFSQSKKNSPNGKNDKIEGVIIFTSHFFLRMSERTGKAYRSRELIQEFLTTKQTHALQVDEDGDVIVKFLGGYGFGVLKSQSPCVMEIRTYLTDKQLTPKQKRKCEMINAYAETIKDGQYLENVAKNMSYLLADDKEQCLKQHKKNLKLAKKLGVDGEYNVMLTANMLFLAVMADILKLDWTEIKPMVVAHIVYEVQEYFIDFAKKYADFDGDKASDEEDEMYIKDWTECAVKAAKKLKLRSMTREAITKHFEKHKQTN
jgi:hypothetical protein